MIIICFCSLSHPDKEEKPIQCCKYPPAQRHPSCYPISIPADDPFYKFFNRQCMDFVRTMPGVKPNCLLGPRHQINQVSSYIDASQVYGNAQSTTKRLREFNGGRMKVQAGYRNMGESDYLFFFFFFVVSVSSSLQPSKVICLSATAVVAAESLSAELVLSVIERKRQPAKQQIKR